MYENLTTEKKLLLDSKRIDITIHRLSQQLIERHNDFEHTVILGMQPRGVSFAKMISHELENILKKNIQIGVLDTTFHRDDFRRRKIPATPNRTDISFVIEKKNVILVDDVLFTGRSVRAGLDAMMSFGRPNKVELMVLVNRKYSRHLPIEADYKGIDVNTLNSQRVCVELLNVGNKENGIWIENLMYS